MVIILIGVVFTAIVLVIFGSVTSLGGLDDMALELGITLELGIMLDDGSVAIDSNEEDDVSSRKGMSEGIEFVPKRFWG